MTGNLSAPSPSVHTVPPAHSCTSRFDHQEQRKVLDFSLRNGWPEGAGLKRETSPGSGEIGWWTIMRCGCIYIALVKCGCHS